MNPLYDSTTPTSVNTVQPPPTFARLPLEGLHVLVVDDSSENLFLFERLLKRNGAQVATAEDGLEGVNLALKNPFHVVLMDIQMPVMDGFTAMTKLKQAGYTRPIIALTAYSKADELNALSEGGFAGHICKPIDKEIFINTVRGLALS